MKTILLLLAATVLHCLCAGPARAASGFTDSDIIFYGEVRQVGGSQTILLQSGHLELTFVNQSNPANRVTLETDLRPTGAGSVKNYSYALNVPLAYLPEQHLIGEYLAIGAESTDFRIEEITIDGVPATLPDGSSEFYGLSFASRSEQYQLDLLVVGDSTDSDGDQLPDWWESYYGLDPELADSGSDFDNDGWSNLEEFRRGSNPAVSNIDPSLATAELLVPEMGEAGCHLVVHDSDTPLDSIFVDLEFAAMNGFELRWNRIGMGRWISDPSVTLSVADLQGGRVTIAHLDPTIRLANLPVSWTDGGDSFTGSLSLRAMAPSTDDGNDASLWLDASALPAGESVATWSDRSGNGRNAVQPMEDHQPQVSSFGNRRSLLFTGEQQHLFFQDSALPAGNHTVLAAWRSPGTSGEAEVLFSSNRGFLRLNPTGTPVSYPGAPVYQTDGLAVQGYESTLGATAVATFRRDGGILQNVFGLSFNGEGAAAEAIDPVLPTIGARRLALPVAEPITGGFEGSLHELLIFPTALPEQKLRDVHDYLQSKWQAYVVWDFSTDLRSVTMSGGAPGTHIIRGGHANDDLQGGDTANIISGGPGADTLRSGPGPDTFVFGGIDTGNDSIVGFDPASDIIDLSALYWGETGDARQFVSTRLDTNFETPVPTLDTVLLVQRPGAGVQEITLRNTILGTQQLIELIVEGRVRMGALSIPTSVDLALAPGSEDTTVLRESLGDSFTVEFSRSGDGTPGALEVPIGLFEDALGSDLVLEGSSERDGQRAVVSFARGETSKLITFRPVPDLETEGAERYEAAVLPHFRYSVAGGAVGRTVSDDPLVSLAVIEANALVTPAQAARVRVQRDGSTGSSLTVDLEVLGTAVEGTHINSVPRRVTIPAGQAFSEVAITAAAWDGTMTRMTLLRVEQGDDSLVGSPHEATVYAAATAPEADEAGFDRWLTAATEGESTSLRDLIRTEGADRVNAYLRAYAYGEQSPDGNHRRGLSIRLVDDRPELTARLASSAADLRWQIQSAVDAATWSDVAADFSETLSPEGHHFMGPAIDPAESAMFFRLAFSLDAGSGLESGVTDLAGSSRYGMDGDAPWQVDVLSGDLLSSADGPGTDSRLIVEVTEPTVLDFEMSVRDGDGSDAFTFFIDGVPVAATSGDAVRVSRTIQAAEPVILMWEFHRASGEAAIRDLAR